MDRSHLRRNVAPWLSSLSNRGSPPTTTADSQGASDEVPNVPSAPQKRSWASIAASSESPDQNKVPRIDIGVPVVSTNASEGRSRGSGQSTGRRQSGEGSRSRARSSSDTSSRGQSGGRRAFVPFVQTRHRNKARWPDATFVPGIIISASHYEEHYVDEHSTTKSPTNDTTKECQNNLFEDPQHHKVCLKQRMMIVVHAFTESYVAVPLYSYGGRGIQHLKGRKRLEHLDIHDHRSKPADRVRQNEYPPLVTREIQHWRTEHILPRTSVYFTYPVSLCYRIHVILIGELTAESTNTLLTYYYREVPARFCPQPQLALQPSTPARPSLTQGTTPVDSIPEDEMWEG